METRENGFCTWVAGGISSEELRPSKLILSRSRAPGHGQPWDVTRVVPATRFCRYLEEGFPIFQPSTGRGRLWIILTSAGNTRM